MHDVRHDPGGGVIETLAPWAEGAEVSDIHHSEGSILITNQEEVTREPVSQDRYLTLSKRDQNLEQGYTICDT